MESLERALSKLNVYLHDTVGKSVVGRDIKTEIVNVPNDRQLTVIREIEKNGFDPRYSYTKPELKDRIIGKYNDLSFLMGYTNDQPIACAWGMMYQPETLNSQFDLGLRKYPGEVPAGKVYNLHSMAVKKNFRNMGVGKEFAKTFEEIPRNLGYDKLVVFSESDGLGFYKKLGYDDSGEDYDDSKMMLKDL